ncbi:MAG: type I restriction enzyme HsdR N-terminal domain-containing protein [Acetobacter sp.]|nr:type I restriction enzyme HsdR N-terminal domain-containing protein [Acetobacter sp.]
MLEMTASDFDQKFKSFAVRAQELVSHCTNEEATKQFLILPFIEFLGYDTRDPREFVPEYAADFSDKYKNRVDYAILKNKAPIIALECKACGCALKDERGQLRAYFNAVPTIKMGILTDGMIYEFYADSDEPNMMDSKAFFSFNLYDVAKGKIEESTLNGIMSLQKSSFDPDNIGAEAKRNLIFQSLVQQIEELSQNPSEPFVRLLLQGAGLTHGRKAIVEYTSLTKEAFSTFINLKILQKLDLPQKVQDKMQDIEKPTAPEKIPEKIEVSDPEERQKISLAMLVTQGFCPVGTVVFDKKRRIRATVTAQGKLQDPDGRLWTPSGLAMAVLNVKSYNGWVFWYMEYEGQIISLFELRAIAAESLKKI